MPYCYHCGKPIKEEDIFCSSCGKPLGDKKREVEKKEVIEENKRLGPAKAIEIICGFVFCTMGIGHIYAGYFSDGVLILFLYYVFLAFEVLILTLPMAVLGLLTFGLGVIAYILFMYFQNLVVATISAFTIGKSLIQWIISLGIFFCSLMFMLYFPNPTKTTTLIRFGVPLVGFIIVSAVTFFRVK